MTQLMTVLLTMTLTLAAGAQARASSSLHYTQFQKTPKLVVVLVIDQFRSDFLVRLQDRFLVEQQKGKVGGFRFLMQRGAYFPFAEYNVLQAMTCPGHAMIMTGATPDVNGIPLNEWFDRKTQKLTYCVEDSEHGVSPKNLKTTTLTDEMKLAGRAGKVFSLSLKDRSAVALGGHHPDKALWFETKENQWSTSSYYGKEMPAWVKKINEELKRDKDKPYVWKTAKFEKSFERGGRLALSSAYGTEILTRLAKEAVVQEKLGRSGKTDFLLVSYSNHDYLGHRTGPFSQDVEELTVEEDRRISELINVIKAEMKTLNDVIFVLTADHGVSPAVEDLQASRIDAGKIDYLSLYREINTILDARYGMPSNKEWIVAGRSFHFYLNEATLKEKKLSAERIQEELREILLRQKGVWKVFTMSDYQKGLFPPGLVGEQIQRQYIPGLSGDLILIPRPYFMEKDDSLTTHMTGFSYDRQVPLIIYGSQFQPGVYSNEARIIDLAPTLSFALGVTYPAGSVGRALPIFKKTKD